MKKSSISDVKDKKAKNILRGMIHQEAPKKIEDALNKIQKSSPNDYKTSISILKGDPLFKKNPVSRYFLKKCLVGMNDLVSYSNREIINTVNLHKNDLKRILLIYKNIYVYINELEYVNALEKLKICIENYGTSSTLLKLLYLIKNRAVNLELDEEDRVKFDKELEKAFEIIGAENVGHLNKVIKEIVNLCWFSVNWTIEFSLLVDFHQQLTLTLCPHFARTLQA